MEFEKFNNQINHKEIYMFHPKYHSILFAFFMAFFMSFLMSAVITFFNMGIPPHFLHMWMKAWLMAFVVAFPIVIFVAPAVRKVVGLLVRVET